MKRFFPTFFGNERLLLQLGTEISQGTLTHAYILEGAAGTGKHTLAKLIAASLSCRKKGDESAPLPCGNCPSCKKILSGFSPDFSLISKGEKATLGADPVRDLRQDVSIAPNDGDTKVYVIEDADCMTVQAQNAFLLTLEEPPKYVLFLLLCEDASALLETVRSRAQILHLSPLSKLDLQDALMKISPEAALLEKQSSEKFEELLVLSKGSLGRALELSDEKKRAPLLALRERAWQFADLCAFRKNAGDVFKFLNQLPAKRDELLIQLEDMELCARDLLICKESESAPLCFFSDREAARELSDRLSLQALMNIYQSIQTASEKLRKNANVRLTVTAFARDAGLLRA